MNPGPVYLLVEPSPTLRSSLHKWLENVLTDRRILVAANGAGALRLAAQEQPSQILMEMDLRDTTGFEIIRKMRQGLPAARIIATGWYESRFFLERVRCAGADRFIPKHKLHRELLPLFEGPPG
jgi:two-component system, OmpR family, KDP operon response regulator KdpE